MHSTSRLILQAFVFDTGKDIKCVLFLENILKIKCFFNSVWTLKIKCFFNSVWTGI